MSTTVKLRLTIKTHDNIDLVDEQGRLWRVYELLGAGLVCGACQQGMDRGVQRWGTFEFLCPDCIELFNPWEVSS